MGSKGHALGEKIGISMKAPNTTIGSEGIYWKIDIVCKLIDIAVRNWTGCGNLVK
jgi:hypothetical protein